MRNVQIQVGDKFPEDHFDQGKFSGTGYRGQAIIQIFAGGLGFKDSLWRLGALGGWLPWPPGPSAAGSRGSWALGGWLPWLLEPLTAASPGP